MTGFLVGAAVGVALGSVPVSWSVHRLLHGADLRNVGSGNPGATNAWRQGGVAAGVVGLAGDVAKGAAAVALARRLGGASASAAAAFGAPLGHALSPWLAFRGGKGVAPALGAFLVLSPVAAVCALGAFVAGVSLTGWVSFGSFAGALALLLGTWASGAQAPTVAAAATGLLLVWRHRENFVRMRAGTEPRVRGRHPRGEAR